ncbi:SAYSvFN domain-containing protein 1 isoform X2 [Chiloscyllium plagiosum]|uniref:SAYSvFN domain-containing protein 1 isoform X2 n=1 Tax=Chiloscyllium plagiosum TaxID=36176 RepID=UPI001CB88A08|nr:SAYSvFN domain-containing protein 1 isoform X2 [Chiloscyllium plagiosum]
MERKLAEWRARQMLSRPRKDRAFWGDRGVFSALLEWFRSPRDEAESRQQSPESSVKEEIDHSWSNERSLAEPVESDHSIFTAVTILKFLLWLVLLGLFIELEFGLAYFVLSMFYWIYVGTRDPSKKKQGEVSAYSVFNPGCKAIEGSLTAEQFERELQYRPMAGSCHDITIGGSGPDLLIHSDATHINSDSRDHCGLLFFAFGTLDFDWNNEVLVQPSRENTGKVKQQRSYTPPNTSPFTASTALFRILLIYR